MKQIKNICLIITGVLLIVSCNKKIESLQTDPNNPTSVTPNLILGNVLNNMSGNGSANLGGINSWDNVHDWNQFHCQNYDYYGNNIYSWTNGSFDPYLVLKNVVQMETEATTRGAASINPYEAVGKFVRAYYYYNMTSLFGDVPQVQALQAGNTTPAYTSQKQVFQYILNTLDTANTHFATLISKNDNSLSATQDLFYQGNLVKWQKLVNSFKLRVLISLSGKASDPDLNVAAQFAAILNNPSTYPIFTSQADDMAYVYNPGGSNAYSQYPFNPSNFGSIAGRFNMASTYVSALTSLSDPRVFVTCEPVSNLYRREFDLNGYIIDSSYTDSNGKVVYCYKGTDSIAVTPLVKADSTNPAQFKLFVGASTGEPLATMYGNANAGKYSYINRNRYYKNFTGEPDVLVGYKELCFNIAEGITRGWATGNAEAYYKTGIAESMNFYGIGISKTVFTAYFLPGGTGALSSITAYPVSFNFANYYAQPSVMLSSTASTAISQIVLQKYIASFENSGYEAYYNWRRTGVPAFQGGSGVGNNGIVPKRWAYPVSEQAQNSTNYKAALTAQGYTADDLNQTMWILK